MQPLDVGAFQPYKHWHDVAIKEALASLDVEYGLRSFLHDLHWTRQQTFKKSTIRSAFRKSGMWPPSAKECLSQLKIFSPPKPTALEEEDPPSLPTLPRTPQKAMEVEATIGKWEDKLEALISSPSRPEWHSFCKGTRQVLTYSQLQETELRVHQKRRQEDLERKVNKRRVVHRREGPITGREVAERIADIRREEEEKEARQQAKDMKKLLSIEKKAKHKEGVEARKQERARIKKIKELTKLKQDIPPELQVPIPDPETIWKAEQVAVLQAAEVTKDDEVTFVIDTQGDAFKFQQDYIPIGGDEGSESGSSNCSGVDSSIYDTEEDYSWHGRKA